MNPLQRRVKEVPRSGTAFFSREGAAADLAPHGLPAWFLDFETVAFPVPDWKGTRPSFQYSLHRLDAAEELTHHAFLDLGGIADGSTAFREAVAESTPADRRRQIEQELLDTLDTLDTLDMVRMWEVLCGAVVSCSENKRPGLLWPPISEAIEKSPHRILFHEGLEQPTALAGKVEQAGPHGQ